MTNYSEGLDEANQERREMMSNTDTNQASELFDIN